MVQLSEAQTIIVTGTVKNEQGKALASALVQENNTKTATYTDSIGNFNLSVSNKALLLVSCKGYRDEAISAKDQVMVVLKPGRSSLKKINSLEDPNATGNISMPLTNASTGYTTTNALTDNSPHPMLTSFTYKEETRGSRYLLDQWAKGYVVDTKDVTIKNDNYAFNYDKITGSLLLTQDKRAAVDVDKDKIKSFTVYNKLDVPITYEIVPAIDNKHFTQILSAGNKYKIYKYTQTTFVKSDYHSDGMTSSGNRYDEYVDESTYYVINLKTAQMQKVALKSKAIKQVFAADADGVKTYYTEHPDDSIDEAFLKGLGDYLNQ